MYLILLDRIGKSWTKIISGLYIFIPPFHLYFHCLISQSLFCVTFVTSEQNREGSALRHGLLPMCCFLRGTGDLVWRGKHSAWGWVYYQLCNIHESKEFQYPHSAISFSGLPHFSVEPLHMSVEANVSLSLSCVAHGPPEPVRVIWLQDGAPLNSLTDPVALSPSTLNLTGIASIYRHISSFWLLERIVIV